MGQACEWSQAGPEALGCPHGLPGWPGVAGLELGVG